MSLKHALLGFLNYAPMTGYELKKFFDTSVAHFWNAELSQIYPTLKQMESEGLVDMDVNVQHDRPNRKVYSISDDGRQELLDWLREPAEKEQVREPILIKMFFGSNASKEDLTHVLRQRIEELQAYKTYLEGCERFIDGFAGAMGMEHEAPFWELTTSCGLRHCETEIEWAEEAIGKIERLDNGVFGHKKASGHEEAMHVKQAIEVLERVASVLPPVPGSLPRKEVMK